jgi:hypothetical protein
MVGLKARIKSNYWVAIAYYLSSDLLARAKFRIGNINTNSGTIHSTFALSESVAYVERVYDDYLRYSGVEHPHGRVAEVGPGDNCGVALMFLDRGCDGVDLVDRFYSKRNAQSQLAIYRALVEKYPSLAFRVKDAHLGDDESLTGVTRYYGSDAAAERFFASHVGYDFIVSRAVFEHLYDPLSALGAMAAALNPGGYLLHKVDLRDHAMFSGFHHELKYLEVPGWLYPWMTRGTGRPNRVLVDKYRSAMSALGLDGELLVTRLAGVGEIEPHRPYDAIPSDMRAKSVAHVRERRSHFARCFRSVSDEDLSVTGFFLVARRGK